MTKKVAIITGFGAGLSEQLAIKLLQRDYTVIGLSRSESYGAEFDKNNEYFASYACDVGDSKEVKNVLDCIRAEHGDTCLLVHNAAQLLLEDFTKIEPEEFELLWRTSCLGAVNVTQQILPEMLQAKTGTLIYTGATASVKAGAKSAAFASAKFALRGLAQSLARAYGSQGIHVIHTVLDGVIWGKKADQVFKMSTGDCMQTDDIAETYIGLIAQKPSSWTHEIDLRPYQETF